jgi:hypothetical protein
MLRLTGSHDPNRAAPVMIEHSAGEKFVFSEVGLITPKGFDQSMRVYEVRWQGA